MLETLSVMGEFWDSKSSDSQISQLPKVWRRIQRSSGAGLRGMGPTPSTKNDNVYKTMSFSVRNFKQTFSTTFYYYFLVRKLTSECVTVSTKIPKPLKEKMIKLKIKPSKLLRKAIEDEVKRKEIEELKEELTKLKPILDKVSMEEIVRSIREDRESR
jgi:hypothetical protein